MRASTPTVRLTGRAEDAMAIPTWRHLRNPQRRGRHRPRPSETGMWRFDADPVPLIRKGATVP
jgi:hypothetical protein